MSNLNLNEGVGEFYWETEHYHHDNEVTMKDYLDNHLPDGFTVVFEDGSYAEVQEDGSDAIFSLDAKGNGDCFHHVINWKVIG